jgi:TrmH family RNA methyltransferase
VRRLRRLVHKRATRWAERAFVAEGTELVRTALAAGVEIEAVYVGGEWASDPGVEDVSVLAHEAGLRVYTLAPGVLGKVADTVTPQPVLAVIGALDRPLGELVAADLVVVGVDLRDPGNAGTVLRSADAAGTDGVVFSGASVDPYNPKTVRSSAGSLFHVPVVVEEDPSTVLDVLGAAGLRRLGAVVRGGDDYLDVDWGVPTALVLGNESAGLPGEVLAGLDGTVGIPMAGQAESLNVGVACAVLCFEALAQRRRAAPSGSTIWPVPNGEGPT